jgi:hypothetical protein
MQNWVEITHLRTVFADLSQHVAFAAVWPQAILSTWEFDGKFLLLAAQAGFSLAVCWILLNVAPATAEALQLRDFRADAFWK